jgi:hypothetical protein
MPLDVVKYLNDGNPPPFFSKLLELLREGKQPRAPASQWIASIKSLSQKGLKKSEVEESGAAAYLASLPDNEVLTKDDLIEQIQRRYYTIKEVLLGSPKYPTWRQPGGSDYREYLYIANSERDNVQDALEDVDFEMEELAFDPELAITQPERIIQLEKRREMLMTKVKTALEFTGSHYNDRIQGRYGKNLLAHCRVSIHRDIYFIDEIQSDWAQQGRRRDWTGVFRGPLVTDTEAWASMVLRRQFQIAAAMPGIKRVAWITESMRNGGHQALEAEAAKAAQRKAFLDFFKAEMEQQMARIGGDGMTEEQRSKARRLLEPTIRKTARSQGFIDPADMLNDFYLMVVPKLANKILGKTGEKVETQALVLDQVRSRGGYGSGVINEPNSVKVPGFAMTDSARQALVASQPMYSRAPLRAGVMDLTAREKEVALAMARAQEMLGTTRHLRFAKHVFDVATGHRVAGRYINRLVQISLQAENLVEATEHECFHFAVDNLMTGTEVAMLQSEFASGGLLNAAVRRALMERGMHKAAAQCTDPMEAAAHGFTLWASGHLDVASPPARGLFSDLVNLVHDCIRWFKRAVQEQRCTCVEDVFEALSSGGLAEHRHQSAHSTQATTSTPDDEQGDEDRRHAVRRERMVS